jgi:hypothetical protein
VVTGLQEVRPTTGPRQALRLPDVPTFGRARRAARTIALTMPTLSAGRPQRRRRKCPRCRRRTSASPRIRSSDRRPAAGARDSSIAGSAAAFAASVAQSASGMKARLPEQGLGIHMVLASLSGCVRRQVTCAWFGADAPGLHSNGWFRGDSRHTLHRLCEASTVAHGKCWV